MLLVRSLVQKWRDASIKPKMKKIVFRAVEIEDRENDGIMILKTVRLSLKCWYLSTNVAPFLETPIFKFQYWFIATICLLGVEKLLLFGSSLRSQKPKLSNSSELLSVLPIQGGFIN